MGLPGSDGTQEKRPNRSLKQNRRHFEPPDKNILWAQYQKVKNQANLSLDLDS
jgi:hypothetical protein|tara:strand:- start:708 stop:866 length:159 start_codon:yes stop_codon:yes gene_type:complete